ncbi:alpha/beta hydrolase fold domain-containing protein [Hyphococcus sp. DH-69]|uniref:alpha/beta hydrolase fold domain-containing protein n=1 Tax=Hyphococcus formosus TaxID=3143534 RepID=UPI00398ABD22
MQEKISSSPSVDPEIQQFVSDILAGGSVDNAAHSLSLNEQRALAEKLRERWTAGGPEVARDDRSIETTEGTIGIRIIRPANLREKCAGLVYLHGGGFTYFSLDTHDRLMREYAHRAGVVVIGIDYSLSPEFKYPTALNETVSVIDWLSENATELGIDKRRLAMAGDSAGANLCVATCLMYREQIGPSPIKALILNYGFFELDKSTESHRLYGGAGELLTSEELQMYWDNYVGETAFTEEPLAFPMAARLDAMPPSYHVIPACDPLADSNKRMVEKMILAGNDVEFSIYETATHSFLEAVSISKLADEALQLSSDWLSKKLYS